LLSTASIRSVDGNRPVSLGYQSAVIVCQSRAGEAEADSSHNRSGKFHRLLTPISSLGRSSPGSGLVLEIVFVMVPIAGSSLRLGILSYLQVYMAALIPCVSGVRPKKTQ
jgi:hypothetical protein